MEVESSTVGTGNPGNYLALQELALSQVSRVLREQGRTITDSSLSWCLEVEGLGLVEVACDPDVEAVIYVELARVSLLAGSLISWWAYCYPFAGVVLLLRLVDLRGWLREHAQRYPLHERAAYNMKEHSEQPGVFARIPIKDIPTAEVRSWLMFLPSSYVKEAEEWRARRDDHVLAA